MAGPTPEFMAAISKLAPEQQKLMLELAWRQDAIDNGGKHAVGGGWHSRFQPGNKEGGKPKKRQLTKTIRELLMRKDIDGKTVAEHLLLEMMARSMEGNGSVFQTLVNLAQPTSPRAMGADEPGVGANAGLTVRIRPHPKLEALIDVRPDDAT